MDNRAPDPDTNRGLANPDLLLAPKMTPEEDRAGLLRQYHACRKLRIAAEVKARKYLCEEQRLAHLLWGRPFPEEKFGVE